LQDVAINRFDQATYFSSLRILQQGRLVEIDIRPSDAFNLAIRNNMQIYINNPILDEAALPEEQQQGPSLG
jgi:bifunctional DNase/RNase